MSLILATPTIDIQTIPICLGDQSVSFNQISDTDPSIAPFFGYLDEVIKVYLTGYQMIKLAHEIVFFQSGTVKLHMVLESFSTRHTRASID